MIKGIHHVSLKCNGFENFEKTVDFYKNILGMEEVRSWGTGSSSGAMLKAGQVLIELFANAEEQMPKGVVSHFAFAVKNVDECVAAVRKAGYEILIEPKDIEIQSTPVYPARIAFCIGPSGEEIEFFEER